MPWNGISIKKLKLLNLLKFIVNKSEGQQPLKFKKIVRCKRISQKNFIKILVPEGLVKLLKEMRT